VIGLGDLPPLIGPLRVLVDLMSFGQASRLVERSGAGGRYLHRFCDDPPHLLRRFDKVRIGSVGVARRGTVAPVT